MASMCDLADIRLSMFNISYLGEGSHFIMVARRCWISSDGSVFTASVQLDHGRSLYRPLLQSMRPFVART